MENKITFKEVPEAISRMSEQINEIKIMLLELKKQQSQPKQNELLTVEQASEFLHLTVPTLHTKVSKGTIPGCYKPGKRLYFDKQVLIDWIHSGKVEVETEKKKNELNWLVKELTKKGLSKSQIASDLELTIERVNSILRDIKF
jgi:excisionase family DNA binding protein